MKYTILIAFSILSHCVFGQSNLTGTWDTGEDNTIIEITEIDGTKGNCWFIQPNVSSIRNWLRS